MYSSTKHLQTILHVLRARAHTHMYKRHCILNSRNLCTSKNSDECNALLVSSIFLIFMYHARYIKESTEREINQKKLKNKIKL
jgi:hypothetical protein